MHRGRPAGQYVCELEAYNLGKESKFLYFITLHIGGFRGQLFGGFAWAEGLPGWPVGTVTAAVWKGEAEAETDCQHLHEPLS